MKSELKEKWLKIYEMALKTTSLQPWASLPDFVPFTFFIRDKDEVPFYTVFGGERMPFCFGFYPSHNEFLKAKKRMLHGEKKNEPDFILQNGIIGIWDDRENILNENLTLIKELGLKFRGKGGWLHFEKFREGYAPAPLNDEDVEFLLSCMSEFVMMMIALLEKDMLKDLKKGEVVVRWYDEESQLYLNKTAPDTFPKKIDYPHAIVEVKQKAEEIKNAASSGFSYELDWSYLPTVLNDDGTPTVPLLLLAVKKETGIVLSAELLSPKLDKIQQLIAVLQKLVIEIGKPKELFVCEDELYELTEDFCNKFGIKLTKAKNLPEVQKARKSFLKNVL